MLYPVILLAIPLVNAIALANPQNNAEHDYSHNIRCSLPGTWYQKRDHPVHALFKRGADDGIAYATVGSPAWSAAYPVSTPDTKALPASWVAALNSAVAAGKIPNIPTPTNTPGTNPIYPQGADPSSPTICSATYKCRIPGDIWDSPDGVFASSFDDGPSPLTPSLVEFLDKDNETTTHFMIGVNIISYPSEFLAAFEADNDIAVHTWTHPYMTTLSNLDIVAQLGWTMQLIHNSTGGRVPRYWRPPYGDSDMRVRAIALEVFGLETVIWNNDTNDWESTAPAIQASLAKFLSGSKSPGLVVLEHEINPETVTGFMNSYPMIKANGWKFMSLAKAVNDGSTYQNADGSLTDDVEAADVLGGISSSVPASSSTSSSQSSSSSTSVSPTALLQSTSTTVSSTSASATSAKSSATTLRNSLPCGLMLSSLFFGALTSIIVLTS